MAANGPRVLCTLRRYSVDRVSAMAAIAGSEGVAAASAGDGIQQQKRQLRAAVRRRLREFPAADRQIEDSAIQKHVLEAEWFKTSRRLCAYVSCPSLREVETSKIVAHILKQEDAAPTKKLYVPRVKDKESHMQMFHIKSCDDLIPNSMNILEPAPLDDSGNPREDVMDAEEPVDLVLLPGLAFDLSGRRLGRGGGYYDLFLENLLQLNETKGWKRPLLVALAYSPQVLDDPVPVDETDVPVDALVCASGARPISSYAAHRLSKAKPS